MRIPGALGRVCLPILLAVAICAFGANILAAQESATQEVRINPGAADESAAAEAKLVYRHARPAKTPAGATLNQQDITAAHVAQARAANKAANSAAATATTGLRFPGDLTYLGGAVVVAAQSHAIYMLPNGNCAIRLCWGDPEGFLNDFSSSNFAHITDAYVGLAAGRRYTVGAHTSVNYKPTPKTAPLTDADIQKIVHAMAMKTGSGYGHIYHVFLPPGQDECFGPLDPAGQGACYSPDVPNNFFFCAYHSSVDFMDFVGHVLYTVEPYQNVPGCSVRPGTPGGSIFNSTANSLSHELIETITDPDGDGWINFSLVVLEFAEIGDECSFFTFAPYQGQLHGFFDPEVFTIGQHVWAVQPEYSNSQHACAISP